jgi:carboxypeptidase family protein/TonB-dependent receptor-like protein
MLARRASYTALVLTVLPTARAVSQEESGRILGRVVAGDAPAAAVRVEAQGRSLPAGRHSETDASGYFRLQWLPVGTYQLRLSLVGYRPVALDSVIVQLGRTTSVGEVRLDPQALELGEIVVVAGRPLVDVTSAATATNLASEQFEDVPTDRNFRSIVSLAPQANLSFLPDDEVNIAGGTGPENAYFLDGVNITDPLAGSTSSNLPYNFIRELQVKAGGYEAEYGRATGGIINVITRSGGNRFGGQAFGFFTGDGLSASPRFALPDAEESQFSEYDFGGSIGGPILRDRLWFFAAYNPSFRRQRVELPGIDLPDETRTQHLFATKLNWQADEQTDVTVTVHGDPSTRRHLCLICVPVSLANPEAITDVGKQGGVVFSGVARRRLGSFEIELGAAQVTQDDDLESPTEFGSTEPLFSDNETGSVSGGLGFTRDARRIRRSVRGSLSAAAGPHEVKVGAEFEDNRYDAESASEVITRSDDTTFRLDLSSVDLSVHNRVPTLYAQDSWRLSDKLRLNLGLRWDGQYFTSAAGESAQSFTDQWQPRMGAIYQLGSAGSHKVFGSYGRFYEQIPLNLSFYYYDDASQFVQLLFDHDPRLDPSGGDTSFSIFSPQRQSRRDLKGQHYDEFTLGYEGALDARLRAGVRGIFRRLRWAVDDAFDVDAGTYELGNPGRGNLAFAPRARRKYTALVLTLEQPRGSRLNFLASYVLSRSSGNYEGLYDFQQQVAFPNTSSVFDFPEQYPNSTGLLPNDRTHVVKFSGAYRLDAGITVGTAISWASGRPRNELGATPIGAPFHVFLRERGSAGRTSSVFDANLRLTYALPSWSQGGVRPNLHLDLFHLGNARTVVRREDVRYIGLDADGNQAEVNPVYNRPEVFQPPMSARLGISLDFGELP